MRRGRSDGAREEDRLSDVRVEDGWVQLADTGRDATPLSEWFARGVAKICVYVDSEEALLDLAKQGEDAGFCVALIQDADTPSSTASPPTPAWRSSRSTPSRSTRSRANCRCTRKPGSQVLRPAAGDETHRTYVSCAR